MYTLGLITYLRSPELTASDELLVEPLRKEGFNATAAPWDDSRIRWSQYDVLILRSCWNYHNRYDQFLSWLSSLEKQHIPLWNPVPMIRWNTDKKYLADLTRFGIPVVPTVVVNRNNSVNIEKVMTDRGWSDVVIKPSVGASAHNVYRITYGNIPEGQKKLSGMIAVGDTLIQPLMKEVMDYGEYSLIFIGGTFSHAVLKIPKKGDFRANYDLGASEKPSIPDIGIVKQAARILDAIRTPSLYARVDGILRGDTFTLMELELTEPHLFFDFDSASALRFAKTIKAYMSSV